MYNHTHSKMSSSTPSDSSKKRFNVDSPSFTPLQPATNNHPGTVKNSVISPKAANAAIFTPKAQGQAVGSTGLSKETVSEWNASDYQEFVPQNFDSNQYSQNVQPGLLNPYEQFNATGMATNMSTPNQHASINPYATDASSLGGQASYFPTESQFTAAPQYHLYNSMGPYRENLLAYQRNIHDFFIPDDLREEMQKKADAAHQILPNSVLPQIDHFHTLVPLDKGNQKNPLLLGYSTWIYKATSSKDGRLYAVRRIEGYRLTDERAIRSVQAWKRINNGSVVSIHDAFTTRAFGDSSLVVVTDYHPDSKTLAEFHSQSTPRFHGARGHAPVQIPELTLWSYIVQIAQALKAIHSNGLAARIIKPAKILLTSKNRIRLNSCSILDVLQYENPVPVEDLQQEDFIQLGQLILSLAINSPHGISNVKKAMEQMGRVYSDRLREAVTWLLTPNGAMHPQSPTGANGHSAKDIDSFLIGISQETISVLDSVFHADDTKDSVLSGELENGRLFRLMVKLGMVNERPEYDAAGPNGSNTQHLGQQRPTSAWSDTGERYYLKLFRDYVFHQVDATGAPVTDLAHVVSSLNKLDAGTEERIQLTSRDEQSVLVVSYRELKRALEKSFLELSKAARV